MAEAAAPVIEDQQPEQVDQVAEPAEVAEPAAEAAPVEEAPVDEAGAAEGGSKRGREEDAVDGEEPEAKKHAGLDEQPNETHEQEAFADGAAAAAAAAAAATAERLVAQYGSGAAATGTAVANGGDNPGHSNAGAEGMYAGVPAGDNPGHFDNPEHAGPPPVKEGLGTTSNEDGSISELIAVSKHLVGKLIGKAGTTIQQLQASTATNIQIDQNESAEHPDTKMVTLRGAPDNVSKAKESIKQLLEEALAPQEGETEEKIPCPAGIVGRIIGRGGETIRSLQQSSGSHIMVDQNFPEGQDRMVIIKGQRDSVERAAAMINELIAGEPGSASAIIAKHSIGINLTVSCPKSMVGRVIGKGGETIKGLQRKYHTSIQVGSQVEQQGDPMTITITGPKGTAEPCKQEILALINDPYPPGPGGPRGMGYPRGPPGYGPPYGGPGPYGGPPPPAYGAPYGAPYPPYGAPYPSPGGYGGYGAPYGAPAAPYSGGASAYGGAGYGQGGYGAAAAGGYSQGYGASGSGYGGEGGSQGAASGGYGGAAAAAPAAASGSVWQPVQDDQGRTYYYNTQTGASQWEKPADMA